MSSMSSKVKELKFITYLVSGSRLFKVEATKPDVQVSQFVDMMAEHFQRLDIMFSGACQSRELK